MASERAECRQIRLEVAPSLCQCLSDEDRNPPQAESSQTVRRLAAETSPRRRRTALAPSTPEGCRGTKRKSRDGGSPKSPGKGEGKCRDEGSEKSPDNASAWEYLDYAAKSERREGYLQAARQRMAILIEKHTETEAIFNRGTEVIPVTKVFQSNIVAERVRENTPAEIFCSNVLAERVVNTLTTQ